MQSRKDIVREYKERQKPAGVFQVKNTENGKFLLASSMNIEGSLNKHKFMLKTGGHSNKALQNDWKKYGADAFVFEMLEVIDASEKPDLNLDDELTLIEQIWVEELDPFGENGYNDRTKIREA